MKILKTAGIVIAAVLAALTLLGIVLPKTSVVERTRVINGPVSLVSPYLFSLPKTQLWSAWAEMDPNQENSYEGEEGTVGSKNTWKGPLVGVGEQVITAVTDSSVLTKLTFFEPFESSSDAALYFSPAGEEKTTVRWTLATPAPFPMNVMFLLMNMEGQIAKDFDRGLFRLDSLISVETARSVFRGHRVETIDFPESSFLMKRGTVSFEGMDAFISSARTAVRNELQRQNLPVSSVPTNFYFKWDQATGTTECAAAFATAGDIKAAKGFESMKLSGDALRVRYYGAPAGSENAHYAIDDYMKANKLVSTAVLEQYPVDFSAEPDTTKWLTEIIYLVKPEN